MTLLLAIVLQIMKGESNYLNVHWKRRAEIANFSIKIHSQAKL